MVFPLLPVLFGAGFGSSLAGIWWYSSMSKDDQVKADQKANELAYSLYSKSVEQLTQDQLGVVHRMVKQQLVG